MSAELILIVDENAANVKLARGLLSAEGYEVRTAATLKGALAVLREFQPRIILMDARRPGSGLLELAHRLRNDPTTRDVVVVTLTAHERDGYTERFLAVRGAGNAGTPVDTRRLAAQVAEWLAWPATERVSMS